MSRSSGERGSEEGKREGEGGKGRKREGERKEGGGQGGRKEAGAGGRWREGREGKLEQDKRKGGYNKYYISHEQTYPRDKRGLDLSSVADMGTSAQVNKWTTPATEYQPTLMWNAGHIIYTAASVLLTNS